MVVYLRLVYVLCCWLHSVIKHDDDDDDDNDDYLLEVVHRSKQAGGGRRGEIGVSQGVYRDVQRGFMYQRQTHHQLDYGESV